MVFCKELKSYLRGETNNLRIHPHRFIEKRLVDFFVELKEEIKDLKYVCMEYFTHCKTCKHGCNASIKWILRPNQIVDLIFKGDHCESFTPNINEICRHGVNSLFEKYTSNDTKPLDIISKFNETNFNNHSKDYYIKNLSTHNLSGIKYNKKALKVKNDYL